MKEFATNKKTNVDVCILGYDDGKNVEVNAKEVEYCIASGYVQVITDDKVYITHISNVVLKMQA